MALGDALRTALANHPDETAASPDIAQRVVQVANLADERHGSAPAQQAAADLAKVAKAEREAIRENGPLSLADRAQLKKATAKSQAEYLRQMSPGGYAAYADAVERRGGAI